MKLKHEDVNLLEDELRNAERDLEKAARIVCPAEDKNAVQMYNRLLAAVQNVQAMIHFAYKLRPEEGDGNQEEN